MISPSRLLPAIPLRPGTAAGTSRSLATPSIVKNLPSRSARRGAVYPWGRELGRALYLVDGVRIVRHDGGQITRADERFPSGGTRATQLPPRLGGGYAFWQVSARGTHLWRAAEWEGRLKPVVSVLARAQQVVAGFDRLYLRIKDGSILGLDLDEGQFLGRGGLPEAPSIVGMAFADAWRGIVLASPQGPLVTFDAGSSWRPVRVAEPVTGVGVRRGDPVLFVSGGSYRIDGRGVVHRVRRIEGAKPAAEVPSAGPWRDPMARWRRGLLRAAIERGFPVTDDAAIVLNEGHLARVSLPSGRLQAWRPDVIAETDADCEGLRVGPGYGFVCGRPLGETTIYAFRPPLQLVVWARFNSPRYVASTGGGALVIRGSCAAHDASVVTPTRYCIIAPNGTKRDVDIAVQPGTERVVALGDGRVAVLVPPRRAAAGASKGSAVKMLHGKVLVIDGGTTSTVELRWPKAPTRTLQVAREGLWVHGFRQDASGDLAGWIEGGGPVLGVRVKLTGEVVFSSVYDRGGQVVLAGRFGLATNAAGGAEESIDGGFSWRRIELPKLPLGRGRARSCGAVGCALASWLRVGWGRERIKGDLEIADLPPMATRTRTVGAVLTLQCASRSHPKVVADARLVVAAAHPHSTWSGVRGEAPPVLPKDAVGVDKSTDRHARTPGHVYVWGTRGSDWLRRGSWVVRYEDSLTGRLFETAPSPSPWSDLDAAAVAIGAKRGAGFRRWDVWPEASASSALVSLCRGNCQLFVAQSGQPIFELRLTPGRRGRNARPRADSVVRIAEDWYWLVTHGREVELWRARGGEAKTFRTFSGHRLRDIKLMRQSHGPGLGLSFAQGYDHATRTVPSRRTLLPIDLETGEFGESIDLGVQNLGLRKLRKCSADDDGWLYSGEMPSAPVLRLDRTRGHLNQVRIRMRWAPDGACIDSLSAVASAGFRPTAPTRSSGRDIDAIPLVVRERYGSRRWNFSCALPPR